MTLDCIRSHLVLDKWVLQSFRNMFQECVSGTGFREHVSGHMFLKDVPKHIPETLENLFAQNYM